MSDELKFLGSRQYGGRGQRSGAIQLIGSKDLAIEILKSRAEKAEAMVERLIEAGERLSIHSRMVDDIDGWNALVAEWQARNE